MEASPIFNLVDLVAHDYEATLAFYRRLGAEVHDGLPGEIRHAHIEFGDIEIHIDNEHLAGLYNSSWRTGEQSRVVMGFRVATREEVDDRYADMTAAGYVGAQPPYDTFWGARYAVVVDPDGTHVGLMSPSDESRRYWPPNPAPVPQV
jgi:uncharacterized glyoxalase superfamily protein PhnB